MSFIICKQQIYPLCSQKDLGEVLELNIQLDLFYYLPMKIYEYMSCGKPVVSTRIGQIGEIIEDQRNGFLTKPNDIEAILRHISNLIENPVLREKIGKEARSDILEKHSWKKRGKQLSKLCWQYSNKGVQNESR